MLRLQWVPFGGQVGVAKGCPCYAGKELACPIHGPVLRPEAQARDERAELLAALAKAKRYARVTGTDERTEITLVFQERDFEPIREALRG